jgi:hypothetical protein
VNVSNIKSNIEKPDSIKNSLPVRKPVAPPVISVDKKIRDPFSKIYDNFEDVFNKKVEIPSKNFLEREINKIQKEIEKEEVIEKQESEPCVFKEEDVEVLQNEENNFIKEIIKGPEPVIKSELKINHKVEIKNQPTENKSLNKEDKDNKPKNKEFNNNSDLSIKDKTRGEVSDLYLDMEKKRLFKGYFDKANFILLHNSKSSGKNEIRIFELNKNLQDLNSFVQRDYFPISYSQSKIFLIFSINFQNSIMRNSKTFFTI